MTNSNDRLNRIEEILEKIASKQEEFNNRIDSNAKAIQALTQDIRDDRRRANEQIARLYEQTVRVSAAQADFYEMQADFYRRIDAVEERYTQMMERVTAVLERLENR
jgi:septal ring factor EnvC (AmiA/AmiB activator)